MPFTNHEKAKSSIAWYSALHCAGPENIHTHIKGGHWKFWGVSFSTAQFFKGKQKAKLERLGRWGTNQTTILGGDVNIFWNHT